jgi:hypothetical protein
MSLTSLKRVTPHLTGEGMGVKVVDYHDFPYFCPPFYWNL